MKKIFSFISILLLLSCSFQKISKTYRIAGFKENYQLKSNINAQKIVYSSLEQVVYIWERDSDLIHIYLRKSKINTIGGSGIGNPYFQNLSDICLSVEGNLLALDSSKRQIKKFDKNGNLIAEISLDQELDPVLLAASMDDKFYVWDSNHKEIAILNHRGKKIEAHADLQLDNADCLEVYDDLISIYDQSSDTTSFYSRFGQLLHQLEGRCFYENDNFYKLASHFFTDLKQDNKFAVNTNEWQYLFFQNLEIILYDGSLITIGKINYELK